MMSRDKSEKGILRRKDLLISRESMWELTIWFNKKEATDVFEIVVSVIQ